MPNLKTTTTSHCKLSFTATEVMKIFQEHLAHFHKMVPSNADFDWSLEEAGPEVIITWQSTREGN